MAAPSKLSDPAGDRVKTDARDAVHLARLLRLDEITAVVVPTVEQEAARDLVRAREDCRGDLMRARHRLSKLLLRQGIVYYGGNAWTSKHDAWLRRIGREGFENAATQLTFDSDYDAVLSVKARRDRLDAAIETMAADSEFTPLVHRLCCLKGVSTLTGFALAVEIGDWHRFTGNTIGSFVGLVPSEHSSGASRVQGPITKTGNTHVRRLLVEAAWHHRARYVAGQDHARPLGTGRPRSTRPRRRRQPATPRPLEHLHRPPQEARSSPTSRSPASSPAGAGPWPSWTTSRPKPCTRPTGTSGAVARRAAGPAAPPASRVAARSLRDGLRPPLTPQPLRPPAGRTSGQASDLPAGAALPQHHLFSRGSPHEQDHPAVSWTAGNVAPARDAIHAIPMSNKPGLATLAFVDSDARSLEHLVLR